MGLIYAKDVKVQLVVFGSDEKEEKFRAFI
jgi:hypothetical protein